MRVEAVKRAQARDIPVLPLIYDWPTFLSPIYGQFAPAERARPMLAESVPISARPSNDVRATAPCDRGEWIISRKTWTAQLITRPAARLDARLRSQSARRTSTPVETESSAAAPLPGPALGTVTHDVIPQAVFGNGIIKTVHTHTLHYLIAGHHITIRENEV